MEKERHPQAVVVLGRNLVVGENHNSIREDNFDLSFESKINAIAGVMVAQECGLPIVFSTGITTPGAKSESEAQRDYVRFKKIKGVVSSLKKYVEAVSIDTATNAIEIARMGFTDVDLVTTGDQLGNAKFLFEGQGIRVHKTYKSEDIIAKRSKRHKSLIKRYKSFWNFRVKAQNFLEVVRSILLHTVDPRGKFLHMITSRTRGENSAYNLSSRTAL